MEFSILVVPSRHRGVKDDEMKIYIREELKRGRIRQTSVTGLPVETLLGLCKTLEGHLHCSGAVVEDGNGVHLKLRGFHCQAVVDLLLEEGIAAVDEEHVQLQCAVYSHGDSKKRAPRCESEQYGRVESYVGNGSFIVRCADKTERLCMIRGKQFRRCSSDMRTRPMKGKHMRSHFRTGDKVLIDLRDFETCVQEKEKETCDLIEIYRDIDTAADAAHSHPLRGGRGRGQGREGRKCYAAQNFSHDRAELDDD
jgi:translation initiation factor 1 (eIF-1/SUI1)